MMPSEQTYKFALLAVICGGFVEVSRAVQQYPNGLYSLGLPVMVLGLILGAAALENQTGEGD